ncbi:hypothetical protein ACWC0C_48240 [Streptomyces sp. NPDC001709]
MTVSGNPSGDRPSDVLDAEHYPDLVLSGGLVAALCQAAAETGVSLGQIGPVSKHGGAAFKTATTSAARGEIVVRLGKGRRIFSISLDSSRGAFVWASGGTRDLKEVVKLMDAWRNGMSLRELGERFPFMAYDRLSLGYEDGTPVETQWAILLGAPEFSEYRGMLLKVHVNTHLGKMFPYFSHETLRLASDCFDRSSSGIFIDPRPDGSYFVWATNDKKGREARGLEEAVAAAEVMARRL